MRVLVTGATGFIGQHLVTYLVQQPTTAVTILVRGTYSHHQQLPPAIAALRPLINVVYADLRNFQLTARAIQQAKPDVVVHLAAAGTTNPFLDLNMALRHNLNGTLNLVRACFEKTTAVQRLIVARTPGERSAMNVYAASKAAAWDFCEMYGRTHHWPIYGAMIFQAYGAGQSPNSLIPAAIAAAQAGQNFPMTAGQQQRDWIHVQDVVAGLNRMIATKLNPATTIELGTGLLTKVADVVAQIFALTNRGGEPLVGVLPSRPGEEMVQMADVGATAVALNWKANISLATGLAQTISATNN